MNIKNFLTRFESYFPNGQYQMPSDILQDTFIRHHFDPCPSVEGMTSIKKQKLLQLAYGCLDEGEAYFEIGTYLGKSLISAMQANPRRPTYACDDFSLFNQGHNNDLLLANLKQYGLADNVQFFNTDFRNALARNQILHRVGVYFYDGAHDELSQHDGIQLVEPLLADHALVIVDDWRLAKDSESYAKAGTERAIQASSNLWQPLFELPARYNGDHGLWWNGVAVFAFNRL
ncbi:MAG: class I SAM-dependent methyltransferase [Pirellulaceae bacterium]|nr:class I SAM-dependent methyltransferase [Pirellulaceae bacterium]